MGLNHPALRMVSEGRGDPSWPARYTAAEAATLAADEAYNRFLVIDWLGRRVWPPEDANGRLSAHSLAKYAEYKAAEAHARSLWAPLDAEYRLHERLDVEARSELRQAIDALSPSQREAWNAYRQRLASDNHTLVQRQAALKQILEKP